MSVPGCPKRQLLPLRAKTRGAEEAPSEVKQ
jgi:hypothetical protein